jgi:hypothetical protein
MPSVFLVSDTHFGHKGVCHFTRNDGVTKLRPWDTPEEMDEALAQRVLDEFTALGKSKPNQYTIRFRQMCPTVYVLTSTSDRHG